MTVEEIVMMAVDTVVGCNGKPEKFTESNQTVYRVGIKVAEMAIDMMRKEIARRQSFIHDALIGQSPEDLERHWRLMGAQDAFKGMLQFIQEGLWSGNQVKSP